MTYILKKLLIVFLVFSSIDVAHGSPKTCESLFNPSFSKRVISKVPSLFIRDADVNPPPTKLFGFATQFTPRERRTFLSRAGYYTFDYIPEKLGFLVTLNRNYTFTPFKAIDEVIFDKPTRALTQRSLGKRKELGILVKLPLIVALSTVIWKNVDQHIFWPTAEKLATVQILEHTNRNANFYDQLIKSDFRYEGIKEQLQQDLAQSTTSPMPTRSIDQMNKNELNRYIETQPHVKARILAYGKAKLFENYYAEYAEIKNPEQMTATEQQIRFGHNPLFQHLNVFIERGVWQADGAYVAPEHRGPVSEGQIIQMFNLTHLLYFKYQVIDMIFTDQIQLNTTSQTQKQMAQDIVQDPYTQELLKLFRADKITSQQLVYFLQEDAYFSYNLSLFNVLNIVEFNPLTQAPLTLNDLRQDRLNSLRQD